MNHKFKNIIAFAIIVGGDKVLDRSPEYIKEKFNAYLGTGRIDAWMWGLDTEKRKLFNKYLEEWFKNDNKDQAPEESP